MFMQEVLQALADKGLTLGSVESMTGGLFASEATSIPGASAVFKGAIVSYAEDVKVNLVGVSEKSIKDEGIVSAQVAAEMANLGRKKLGVDVCVSVTGNAGPTAQEGEAGVGEFFLGLSTKEACWTLPYKLEGKRNEIRAGAVDLMIQFLASFLK